MRTREEGVEKPEHLRTSFKNGLLSRFGRGNEADGWMEQRRRRRRRCRQLITANPAPSAPPSIERYFAYAAAHSRKGRGGTEEKKEGGKKERRNGQIVPSCVGLNIVGCKESGCCLVGQLDWGLQLCLSFRFIASVMKTLVK